MECKSCEICSLFHKRRWPIKLHTFMFGIIFMHGNSLFFLATLLREYLKQNATFESFYYRMMFYKQYCIYDVVCILVYSSLHPIFMLIYLLFLAYNSFILKLHVLFLLPGSNCQLSVSDPDETQTCSRGERPCGQ